ncbi:hypothetical protein EJB05_38933, partial [Eragrostis curvula]
MGGKNRRRGKRGKEAETSGGSLRSSQFPNPLIRRLAAPVAFLRSCLCAMELPVSGNSGKRRRSVKRSLEYPCVSRFRHRRLLAYLRLHRLDDSFESLALETNVFFCVEHLQDLARRGEWVNAIKYISRFAPSTDDLGDAGLVFYNFVVMHRVLDSIVAGEEYGAFIAGEYERYLKENPGAPPGNVKLVRILSSVLNSEKLSRIRGSWNASSAARPVSD